MSICREGSEAAGRGSKRDAGNPNHCCAAFRRADDAEVVGNCQVSRTVYSQCQSGDHLLLIIVFYAGRGSELLPKAKLVNDPERQIYVSFHT